MTFQEKALAVREQNDLVDSINRNKLYDRISLGIGGFIILLLVAVFVLPAVFRFPEFNCMVSR